MVKRLFAQQGPGAGLVDRPVRLSALVSFRGEKRTLGDGELRKLVKATVDRAVQETGEAPIGEGESAAVARALERTLTALGDLDMDDVQAVRLGHEALADSLHAEAGGDELLLHLSRDSELLYFRLLTGACLHILHFFTQRSTFVPRTLVEQSQRLDELIRITGILAERLTSRTAQDAAFEQRYARYIATRHSSVTIYGIDLDERSDWPLDTAYLSLEADRSAEGWEEPGQRFGAHRLPPAPQPVEQALAGHARVLLRGVAGSGKTTLVQWLAVTTARQKELPGRLAHLMGRVPFVLPLRTLTRGGARLPAPGDFLSAVGCPLTGSQPHGWADRVLAAGRGLLLIDGIDEVLEQERGRTRRWLADLLAAFPGNLCLVTSRPSAVRAEWLSGEDFTELTLSPMSRESIAVFVGRWHRAADADPALGRRLLDAVRTKQDLGRLVTNPLMCALVCALHRERRGFLPRGRKALYDAALSMLLERRDRERDLAVELDEESQVELLQRLAYWLIRNGRAEMERATAVHQLERLLPSMPHVAEQGSAQDVLRHLLVRSGLLREPATGAVDFVHRTFQDYLGARAAVEERDFDVLIAHAHLDQWEDVVRLAVAHARPGERARLLTGLLERGDQEEEHRTRLHLLATACLEHAAKLDPGVREEVERRAGELIPPRNFGETRSLADLGPMVLELLPGPEAVEDGLAAARVVHTAALVGGDAALPLLIRYREHESEDVRIQLGLIWDRFDTEAYTHEIVRHLLKSPKTPVHVRTPEQLAALGSLGGHGSVDLIGDFTPAQIREAFGTRQARRLGLALNSATDLRFLSRYQDLRALYLQGCPNISSLDSLSRLPLETLVLFDLPEVEDLSPIRELTGLTTLSLGSGTRWPGLGVVSREAPLQCLFLSPDAHDLSSLVEFPSLNQIGLDLGVPLAPEDWEAIASLAKLRVLSLNPTELADLESTGLRLDGVALVHLISDGASVDLRPVVAAFPSMTTLQVHNTVDVDLAPLAAHPRLREVFTTHVRGLLNADTLPGAVQLNSRPVNRVGTR
nr:NACHT domain-containing protein [Streptomyces pacificus]